MWQGNGNPIPRRRQSIISTEKAIVKCERYDLDMCRGKSCITINLPFGPLQNRCSRGNIREIMFKRNPEKIIKRKTQQS
jgi:hypothetical protein